LIDFEDIKAVIASSVVIGNQVVPPSRIPGVGARRAEIGAT
jgi:hypothetical protein